MIANTIVGLPRRPAFLPQRSGTLAGLPARPFPKPAAPAPTPISLGRYELTREIGKGAMGSAWLATDFHSGRELVVKLAKENFALFLNEEARILSQLCHPNIVTYIDSGNIDGVTFMATEQIRGKTLAALILDRELDLPRLLTIVAQVCFGLEYLHNRDLVHCDVKPANIMVTTEGTAKLIDFGLTQPADENALAQCGTKFYRAPEQARGELIDGRADQHALGVTFNEALSYLDQQGRASASRLDAFRPIIQRMTAEEPGDRYPTIRAALNDILKIQLS